MDNLFSLVIGCLIVIILICIFYVTYLLCKRDHNKEKTRKSSIKKFGRKISVILDKKIPLRKKSNTIYSPRFVIPTCSPTTVACQVQLPLYGNKVDPRLTTDITQQETPGDSADDVFLSSEKDEHLYDLKPRGRSQNVENFGTNRDKERSKSLPGARFKDKIRRISQDNYNFRITTPIVPFPKDLGETTLKLTYDSTNKTFHIRVVSLSNLYISANAFLGIVPVYSEWDMIPTDVTTPYYLVRKIDKKLAFNDTSGVLITTQLNILPKNKIRRPTTNIEIQGLPHKHLVANQEYLLRNVDEMVLKNSTLCMDILCYYGTESEEKLVIGQAIKKLKDLRPMITETVELDVEEPKDQMEAQSYSRPKDDLGEVMICLGHNPLAGTLSVRLEKVTNLLDIGNSKPQIQVRLLLYFCDARIDKQQSSISLKSNNPVFDELFKFSLSREKIAQSSLLLEIRHCGVVSKTTIGFVALGSCYKGLSKFHWDKMTSLNHSNLFETFSLKILAGKPKSL